MGWQRGHVPDMSATRQLLAAPLLWVAGKILGFHESAQRWSNDRGYLPGRDRDAHLDLTQMDLSEQRRKAKFFEANTDLVPAMASVFEQYTVGRSGLRISSGSSSEQYNAIANEITEEWWQLPEINSQRNFSETLSLCAWTWFVQGEVFLFKTFGSSPEERPRIQVFEPHRVFSDPFRDDSERIRDGIETDKTGRPVAYHIAVGKDAERTRRIPAFAVHHICEPSRAGQIRCGPMFSNVMGLLQDLEQVQRNYMRSSKISSALAAVFKNRNKQIPTDATRAQRMSPSLRTNQNAASEENREQYVRQVVGGELLAMYPDESIEFPENNNPTLNQQAQCEMTMARICIGAGIPPQLVMPKSLQGTVTRADLDRSASLFRMRSEVLQRAAKNIRNWMLQDAHKYDARFRDVEIPSDWQKCSCRPPRQVNVDVGRNTSALLSEYRAGFRTLESIVGELGETVEETIRAKAREARLIQRIASEEGVPVGSITDSILTPQGQPA
jgi:capsid protein